MKLQVLLWRGGMPFADLQERELSDGIQLSVLQDRKRLAEVVLADLQTGKFCSGMVLAVLQGMVWRGRVMLAGFSAPVWCAEIALTDRKTVVLSGRIGLVVRPASSRQAETMVAELNCKKRKSPTAATVTVLETGEP